MEGSRSCRVCGAQRIVTVLVIEQHRDKIRTAHHCPCCGEELFVVWSKKRESLVSITKT